MATLTRQITSELGETGAGIERAEDIDMTRENHFTNLWAKHREKSPWYFEMRSLIADRPNAKPIGIGHSESEIDPSVLALSSNEDISQLPNDTDSIDIGDTHTEDKSGFTSDDDDLSNQFPFLTDIDNSKDALDVLDEFDPDNQPQPSPKAGVAQFPKQVKANATAPRPGVSKPVKLEEKKVLKRSKQDEFAEIAKEEEKTAQNELELAKLRTKLETVQASGMVQVQVLKERRRAEEMKMKMEAREKDKQRQHEVRMAMLNRHLGVGNSMPVPGSSSSPDFGITSAASSSMQFSSSAASSDSGDIQWLPHSQMDNRKSGFDFDYSM
ncbi:hypothetical protein EV361DRAFT_942867 [Lentinula raphanica]|nr:hypothetical protein EV361DRAFT_942867 [Lentinula raphanica]